jgi:amino acid adenylation domain-containing protein
MEGGSGFYNIAVGVRMIGELRIEEMERSVNEIVRRHEVLRTSFGMIEGEPVQEIKESEEVRIEIEDMRGVEEGEREERVREKVEEEAGRGFDLRRGPLMRVKVIRVGEEEHIGVMTMHHIVSDGWSMGLLIKEVGALYEAYSRGEESPLPELEVQYADFAAWQREYLQGEVLDQQINYWKRQLESAPAVLEMPTDRPRPAVQGYLGGSYSMTLSRELTEELKQLSRRENVTLFMTLLAGFETLLMRYSHQEEVMVGTPIANRNRSETESLIGFFVNTLVLRGDLRGDPKFTELLARAREVTLGAYAHQDLPFERLVEEMEPERSMSHSPLFQIMFVLQNMPIGALELPGLRLDPIEINSNVSKFDLVLDARESDGALYTTFEYSKDLFDETTIRRMMSHLETMLKAIVTDPQQRLSALPLFSDSEREEILIEWNDTAGDYPDELCAHELFQNQARINPQALAVSFEKEQLTYAELNRRANQLAHHLQSIGVGPEALVAICMERSIEMIVAVLGVLKAGGAYIPLDPTYPIERLALMLEDAQAKVLLTQARLAHDILLQELHVVCMDKEWATIARNSSENPTSGVERDNLAYVIYTSGSTGKPKGVLISHRAVVNHNFAIAPRYNLNPSDNVLQFAALSFDVAVEEMFPTWLSGAKVVLRPDSALNSHAAFLEFLAREAVTVVNLPTPYWNELIAEQSQSRQDFGLALRLAAVGGEKGLIEQFSFARHLMGAGLRLMNVYGPTETTVTNTIYEWAGEQALQSAGSVPIGRPVANTRMYILDKYLYPVPIGVAGEVYISGDSMARGYLNRPELTAEKFIPDHFANKPGGRLYKTGDVGRFLDDGNIEFLGRIDQQVKVRGFRIELGEIESILSQYPGLREVVVIAREDVAGDKSIVAYMVANGDNAPTTSELRSYVQSKLPDYMVPSWFIPLEELPLTSNGKVDRKRLPAPTQTRPEIDEQFVAPRTPIEEAVAAIWSKVLGIEQIGIYDQFFELGGHSLLATQVVSRVRDMFEVDLTLRNLFEKPTVADLSLVIEDGLIQRLETLTEEEAADMLRKAF